MATTTIWVPGAFARIGGNPETEFSADENVVSELKEIIKGTSMIYWMWERNSEYPVVENFYIPVPTIAVLNDKQLYLKRFTVSLEFMKKSINYEVYPIALVLYDGLAKVFSAASPDFTNSYERRFPTGHKVNMGLTLGLEVNIPPGKGIRFKILGASFDFDTEAFPTINLNAFLLL